MPVFECAKCRRKTRAEYDLSCTGDTKRNVEKAPWCCGQTMVETLDD